MTNLNIAVVDDFVARHGQFTLLDWLLDANLLAYSDYESWRYGVTGSLDDVLLLSAEELQRICDSVVKHCAALKLSSDAQAWFGWGDHHHSLLQPLKDADRNVLFCRRWTAPQDLPQMDLFMDNSAVIAENRLIEAMANRQFDVAQAEMEKLSQLNVAHPKLGGYQDLIHYGRHMQSEPTVPAENLEAELQGLESEVLPLAGELLGNKKRDYLSQAWRRLADNLQRDSRGANDSRLHASYALQAIPDWHGVQSVLEKEGELIKNPELMARLAEAYLMNKQTAECYWMWVLLFDHYSDCAEMLLGSTRHSELPGYWDDFLSTLGDEVSEAAFAGYLLLRQPGLTHSAEQVLGRWQTEFDEACNRDILCLIQARLTEKLEKTPRAALQLSCPQLLKAYLNKRDWYASRCF